MRQAYARNSRLSLFYYRFIHYQSITFYLLSTRLANVCLYIKPGFVQITNRHIQNKDKNKHQLLVLLLFETVNWPYSVSMNGLLSKFCFSELSFFPVSLEINQLLTLGNYQSLTSFS